MLSALAQLRLIGAVASPDRFDPGAGLPGVGAAIAPDFKALVCIFLAGGNDANNLVIPSDTAVSSANLSVATKEFSPKLAFGRNNGQPRGCSPRAQKDFIFIRRAGPCSRLTSCCETRVFR